MMLRKMTVCVAALMLVWGTSFAQTQAPVLTNGVLVKLRAEPSVKVLSNADHARTLSAAVKKTLKVSNGPAPDMRLVHGDGSVSDAALAEALRQAPNVELAVPNRFNDLQALPNDPYFGEYQWYLQANDYAAIRAQGAWDITTGSPSVPVAVVDTGVRPEHPDLAPNLLPGYDFTSYEIVLGGQLYLDFSLDGDDIDPDPSDPGDFRPRCIGLMQRTSSSWHGTMVSGLIAAAGNNSQGIAGLNWNGRILPVRVGGQQGISDAAAIAGIRWAAGMPVIGVPDNPHPVKVINASFGAEFGGLRVEGTCREIPNSPNSSPFWAELASDLTGKGVMLVAAAGNNRQPVAEPANCPGAIAVAALTDDGYKAEYSSFGPDVFISAPGGMGCYGEPLLCGGLLTTVGSNGYSAETTAGTSFAAPLVSGAIALMLSANSTLTPNDVKAILKETARPFPYDPSLPLCSGTASEKCNCTTDTCGAGILDVEAAVRRAYDFGPSSSQPEVLPPEVQPAEESSGGGGAADWLALFGLLGLAAGGKRRLRKA
ncbi:MAG: S8 family serine peptidase [Rhodocyclaceae bacterium]|nr:S8 family serine peptidase [Rhodocyclaceae bacterium]